ncbi:helix-turn-helix domain-containing protein [Jannaschia sp. 2305UL9-9]|uniref:helix-turn-helix domain-containing protein n=1 Tax=Jannaschia sp. 2305UL9-9 TaxID=3121638 RepID=UPI003527F40D
MSPDRGFDSYEMRLGDEMRGERATLGKSLMDVQRELRIRASYIAAIENADLSAFDSQSFVAGYVRSYARYLAMDPEIVFARFCEESGFGGISALKPMESEIPRKTGLGPLPALGAVASGTLAKKNKAAAPVDPLMGSGNPFANKATPVFAGFEPGALGSLAVLALLVGGLGYGGWTLVQEIQRVQVAPVEQAPELVAELDPLAPTLAQSDTPEVVGVDVPAPSDALTRLYRPQALDAPILTARDAPIATIRPGTTGALASATPTTDSDAFGTAIDRALAEAVAVDATVDTPAGPTTPKVLASAPDAVVIVAARNAWVRVRTADGQELLQRELAAGDTFEIPATDSPVSLRTGNTGAVFFSVAGQTYGPIAPGAQVLTTDISAELVTETYALADLTDDSDIARVVAELAAEPALPGADTTAE